MAATLDSYLPAQASTALASVNETRDVVFMDARGSGQSTPSLDCPEYGQALADSFSTNLSPTEDGEALLEGYRRCRSRLDGAGVPTSHVHSKAIVDDTVEILDALGYDGEVNVYGLSYGGRIAQVFVREYPERTRSVILDSTSVVNLSFAAGWPANFQTALDAVFAACASSDTCSADHPNLEDDLFAAVAMLDDSPVSVDASGQPIVINGSRILVGVQGVLYDPSLIRLLPNAIEGVLGGSTLVLQALAPALLDTTELVGGALRVGVDGRGDPLRHRGVDRGRDGGRAPGVGGRARPGERGHLPPVPRGLAGGNASSDRERARVDRRTGPRALG